MASEDRRERIEGWVGDFLGSTRFVDALAGSPAPVREYASEILAAFLRAACDARDVGPEDVEESDVRAAVLEGLPRLELPASVREGVPALCGAFLEEMEASGRLSGGRALATYVRALRDAYLAAAGPAKPFVNPAAKLGRNDPCPCGSGKKYKKCCGAA